MSSDEYKDLKPADELLMPNSSTIKTKNLELVEDPSIISFDKVTYDLNLSILKNMTGYPARIFKGYPDDEEILSCIQLKLRKSSKNVLRQSNKLVKKESFPSTEVSSVIDILNTIIPCRVSRQAHNKTRHFDCVLDDYEGDFNNGNVLSKLFENFTDYIRNERIFNFQSVVKGIFMFIYLSKKSLITNFHFPNNEARKLILFLEIMGFSDIFFSRIKMNDKLLSKYDNTKLFQNLFGHGGQKNPVIMSYDDKKKRLIAKSNSYKIPINYFDAKINIPKQTIEFNGNHCLLNFEKKKEGACSGMIINFFYKEALVEKLFCKELFCFSEEYQEHYEVRFNFFKQWSKENHKSISKSQYSKLANVYNQIPSYSKYNELRLEYMSKGFMKHFNPHVELFGYYLLNSICLCPDFTVYRSEFDSKTYIIMESLSEKYKFCDEIGRDHLSHITVRDLVYSTIKIHYLKVIQQIFLISDFHERNVALEFGEKNIPKIRIIDLFPSFLPLKITQITYFENLKDYAEHWERLTFDDDNYLFPAYYTALHDFQKLKNCDDLVLNDIMSTKKYRFLMLTYHAYYDIINDLVIDFFMNGIKYDKKHSLCCFAVKALFDDVCNEIEQKQLISGEFEHKDEYISHVMGNIGMFIHQLLYFVNNDCFNYKFLIYRAQIIQYEDSENWNKSARHYKDGLSYYLTSWRMYLHRHIKPDDNIWILYSATFEEESKFIETSKKILEKNPDQIHIWVDDPVAFDVCVYYFKNQMPCLNFNFDVFE